MTTNDAPLDLYIAAYGDEAAAQQDWDGLKDLARDKIISVDALVLVRRDLEGKIQVQDSGHEAGLGAVLGAVGGALVGLIFPPTLLASAAVGAGIGAGAGAITDLVLKHQIKADLEEVLVPGSSGIIAVFEERWVSEVEKALARADRSESHDLTNDSPAATSSPVDPAEQR